MPIVNRHEFVVVPIPIIIRYFVKKKKLCRICNGENNCITIRIQIGIIVLIIIEKVLGFQGILSIK